MNNLGLRVESTLPSPYSCDVNINSDVKITFNSDLNTSTIVGNFLVLQDIDYIFEKDKEIDLKQFKVVKGTVTYKDKTIIFTPLNQLEQKGRYIIYVRKNSVRDILGRAMLTDYTAIFDTEGTKTVAPCKIIEPVDNSVITSLNKIILEDLNSDKYLLQISKQKTFENAVYDEIEESTNIEKNFNLKDGLYYLRAKAYNGDFGETISIALRSHKETIVTDQDIDDGFIYEPIEEETLEIMDYFPKGVNVHEKTSLSYMKLNGKVDLDMIDFDESFLYGELSDIDDEGSVKEHQYVDGSFSVVYDEENDCTYIIMIPEEL